MIGPHSDRRLDMEYNENAYILSILSLISPDMQHAAEKDLRLMLYMAARRARTAPEAARTWVPVSERIPELHVYPQKWLVFDGQRVCIETAHPTWWNKKDDRGKKYDGPTVTHWMPLPPAPQSGSPSNNG